MKIIIGVANQLGANVYTKLTVLMAELHDIDTQLIQKFDLNKLKTNDITIDGLSKSLSTWLDELKGDDVYITTSDIVVIELFRYASKIKLVDDVTIEFWNLNDNNVNIVSCVNGRLSKWYLSVLDISSNLLDELLYGLRM